MTRLIELAGNAAGGAGLLVCALAGLARLSGAFYTVGFQTMVLFDVGIGLMVAGCLAKVHVLASRR